MAYRSYFDIFGGLFARTLTQSLISASIDIIKGLNGYFIIFSKRTLSIATTCEARARQNRCASSAFKQERFIHTFAL
jgi:hypothetical protein